MENEITLEDLYKIHEELNMDIEIDNGNLVCRYNDYDQ